MINVSSQVLIAFEWKFETLYKVVIEVFLHFRDKEIIEFRDTIKGLQEDLVRHDEEKSQLLVKIEAGEGANTALTQLREENVSDI